MLICVDYASSWNSTDMVKLACCFREHRLATGTTSNMTSWPTSGLLGWIPKVRVAQGGKYIPNIYIYIHVYIYIYIYTIESIWNLMGEFIQSLDSCNCLHISSKWPACFYAYPWECILYCGKSHHNCSPIYQLWNDRKSIVYFEQVREDGKVIFLYISPI